MWFLLQYNEGKNGKVTPLSFRIHLSYSEVPGVTQVITPNFADRTGKTHQEMWWYYTCFRAANSARIPDLLPSNWKHICASTKSNTLWVLASGIGLLRLSSPSLRWLWIQNKTQKGRGFFTFFRVSNTVVEQEGGGKVEKYEIKYETNYSPIIYDYKFPYL